MYLFSETFCNNIEENRNQKVLRHFICYNFEFKFGVFMDILEPYPRLKNEKVRIKMAGQ